MSEEELIETLKAFEKNRVEQLKEPARNLFYTIMKIADERDRLNNIINKFDKWLDEESEKTILSTGHLTCLMMCKNKLHELKGE